MIKSRNAFGSKIFGRALKGMLRSATGDRSLLDPQKYANELAFRRGILIDYQRWFRGELTELYGVPAPTETQKVRRRSLSHSAILTYLEMVQKPKYLQDLELHPDAFLGMRVLDVGSGPMPSALVFDDIDLYCLDPLMAAYIDLGFPLHEYDRVRFVHSYAEDMPFDDGFFDAVISVNAIDHVDDFMKTAAEIGRVLRPDGRLHLHVHYHDKTSTEPIELNDAIVEKAFAWCKNLRKLSERTRKFGSNALPGESFAVWGNP